jgi:hypothetical protein
VFRALVAFGVIVALFFSLKNTVLDDVGLVGACKVIDTPPGMGGEWLACRSGKLDGYPNLAKRSCTSYGRVWKVEYWSCPFLIERQTTVSAP